MKKLFFLQLFILVLFSLKMPIYGVDKDKRIELYIGLVAPLFKEGAGILQGMNLAFYEANKKHDGVILKCLALNDFSQIAFGAKQISDAFKLYKKTSIFMNIFTPGVLQEVLPYVLDEKIFIFSSARDDELMKPKYKYMVNAQPPISREYEAIIDYSKKVLKRSRFAIFYVEDEFGLTGKRIVEEILAKKGLKPVAVASHPAGVLVFKEAVKKFTKISPDAVIFITQQYAAHYMCIHLTNAGLLNCSFLGTSCILPIQKGLMKARGIRVIATSVVPDPENSNILFVQNFRKNVLEYSPNVPLTASFLSSYLAAKFLGEIIKGLNGEISIERIVQKMESIKNYDIEGLIFNFNPNTRSVFEGLWLSPGNDKPWIDLNNGEK